MTTVIFVTFLSLCAVESSKLSPTSFGSRLSQSVLASVGKISAAAAAGLGAARVASAAPAARYEYQPALEGLDYGKPRTIYPDFEQVCVEYVVCHLSRKHLNCLFLLS